MNKRFDVDDIDAIKFRLLNDILDILMPINQVQVYNIQIIFFLLIQTFKNFMTSFVVVKQIVLVFVVFELLIQRTQFQLVTIYRQ